jgi:hypothetical protein
MKHSTVALAQMRSALLSPSNIYQLKDTALQLLMLAMLNMQVQQHYEVLL